MPEQSPASSSNPLRTVCGREMTTAPENYYSAEFRERVIYYCTSFCLDAFRADPDRFYAAHSRNSQDPQPCAKSYEKPA